MQIFLKISMFCFDFVFCSNKYYIACISNISYWFVTRFNYSYIPIMLALCGLLWDLNYSLHGHICLTKLANESRTMSGHLSEIKGEWWEGLKYGFLEGYK